MAPEDEEPTVFGQKRPLIPVAPGAPTTTQQLEAPRAPGPLDELTVFGQKLPTQVLVPGPGNRAGERGDTWLGGRVMPPVRRTNMPTAPPMRRLVQQPPRLLQRVAFVDALRSVGLETGASSNRILAAASDLLALFGRLRTGMVEMPAQPLYDHIVREIAEIVRKCRDQNVPSDDIAMARYALAAMADDVIENIPGNDPAFWREHSIAAKLLDDQMTGTGFFTRVEQIVSQPKQRSQLLELMLTCLALGFQGQYRDTPDGQAELSRLRAEVYQHFRAAAVRPPTAMSHKWKPVVLPDRLAGDAPLWVIGGVAAAVVVAQFATLSWILSADAQAAQNQIIALHAGTAPVEIQRAEDVVAYEAPPTGQLGRLKEQFEGDIALGTLEIEEQGDFIVIRERDALRFGSGAAGPANELDDLAKRVAAALDAEPGAIIIEGHSDNIPLRGTGRYKTNEELSAARAAAVRDLLAPHLSDPTRISIVGVGPSKPLDPTDNEEARAQNRRVEILLAKEQQL